VGSSGGGQLDDGAARRSMSRAGETELWACNNEEAKEVTRGSGDRNSDVKLKKLARVARLAGPFDFSSLGDLSQQTILELTQLFTWHV
jgi:hypothetical protein